MNRIKKKVGQTLVEYGLIVALVSTVLVGALLISKSGISNTFSKVTTVMESATAS